MNRIWLVILALVILGCKTNAPRTDMVLRGETMGTYYAITFPHGMDVNKSEIDDLLESFNEQVSTYIPTSTISRFNQSETSFSYNVAKDRYFDTILITSGIIYQKSEGYFDPSVMPLVNYWGFGYKERDENFIPDSLKIKKILSQIGLLKLRSTKHNGTVILTKHDPSFQLDFSAIAKGYGVDLVAEYLDKKGIKDYLIDIGGEGYCRGFNKNGDLWNFGISTPDENAPMNDLTAILAFSNKAIATSGNYRNYYLSGDQKYVHTVNPKSGFSESSDLLSVTVVSGQCMKADAYATSMMAMGSERARALAKVENIDALLITGDGEGGYLRIKTGKISNYLK